MNVLHPLALSCKGNLIPLPQDQDRVKLHGQCNEAQCSQGLQSISKCLNISPIDLFLIHVFSLSISGLSPGLTGRSLFSGYINVGFNLLVRRTGSTMLMYRGVKVKYTVPYHGFPCTDRSWRTHSWGWNVSTDYRGGVVMAWHSEIKKVCIGVLCVCLLCSFKNTALGSEWVICYC